MNDFEARLNTAYNDIAKGKGGSLRVNVKVGQDIWDHFNTKVEAVKEGHYFKRGISMLLDPTLPTTDFVIEEIP